jgi:hypothetical protein
MVWAVIDKPTGSRNSELVRGWSFPFLLIILIAIVILFIFYGWIIILGVVVLFFGITLMVFIHDKVKEKFSGGDKQSSDYDKNYGPDLNRKNSHPLPGIDIKGKTCLTCGSGLFSVVTGETTREDIVEFARNSKAWRENPDALDGWMHPGLYCPNGCVSVLADY